MKEKRPELVFLAEAFTRPKMMHRLAKSGFDMSARWRKTTTLDVRISILVIYVLTLLVV